MYAKEVFQSPEGEGILPFRFWGDNGLKSMEGRGL